MNDCKVSVLVPVYDAEKYIRECLDSILGQTLRDIEIILIDDGSTDGSGGICDEYAGKDGRIKVSHIENRGVALARNLAIDRASGKYVCFMDPDDLYPEGHVLEKLYQAASQNSAMVVGGSFSELNANNGNIRTEFNWPFLGYTFKRRGFIDFKDYQFNYGFHRFLYNRKFLNDNGIRFPDYKRYQDPVFLVKVLIAAERFYAIPDVTYRLRFGHKDYLAIWENKQKLNDAVNGIADVLWVACENNLKDLYRLTERQLKDHCYSFSNLIERLKFNNNDLKNKVSEIHIEYEKLESNFRKLSEEKTILSNDNIKLKLECGDLKSDKARLGKEFNEKLNQYKNFRLFKYWKYKVLSKILFGNIRKRYKEKYRIQKNIYRELY